MSIGVISHLDSPTLDDVELLARSAEEVGADWLGLPDAYWWRDTWLLAAAAARSTEHLVVGPVVTNPYLRHPFHTVAALATLQGLAGNRVQLGLGAGGSEAAAAGVDRTTAPERIEALATLVRQVAGGAALDQASGRTLEVPLARPSILVAGRADAVLRAAGRVADRALLWSVPASDLGRSVDLVAQGAAVRAQDLGPLEVVWAPAVAHDAQTREHLLLSAPYAVLNSRPALQAQWGLDPGAIERLRTLVVAGRTEEAADLVPDAARSDLVVADPDPGPLAERVRALGLGGLAVPVADRNEVAARVAWARRVLAAAGPDDGERHVEVARAGADGASS